MGCSPSQLSVEKYGDVGDSSWEDLCSLASDVVRKAIDAGVSLGTAESCTGGLVSGALTAVPGSSQVVYGGVTSYALSVKHDALGVSQDALDIVGAVSAECAAQMCSGASRVLGVDIAVSVTGIAGPGGAEPGKPVGTVWFGLLSPSGVRAVLRTFSGSREEVRRKAVSVALNLLLEAVEKCTVR